jgi:[ribosomal protein S5]-alanine N-acetyltransferase
MTEPNFVDFKCPFCGEPNSFLDSLAGTAQACPHCRDSVLVPRESCEVGSPLPLPITAARLVLRRLQPSDWRDLMELSAEEGIPREEEEILRWLEADQNVRLTQTGQWLHLGLEQRSAGKLVGYLSVSFKDETHRQMAVTVSAKREALAQGDGTDALRALFDWGFGSLGLVRIAADCDSLDATTRQMFETASMRREGEFLKDRFIGTEWVTTVFYAILAEEHAAQAGKIVP